MKHLTMIMSFSLFFSLPLYIYISALYGKLFLTCLLMWNVFFIILGNVLCVSLRESTCNDNFPAIEIVPASSRWRVS